MRLIFVSGYSYISHTVWQTQYLLVIDLRLLTFIDPRPEVPAERNALTMLIGTTKRITRFNF